MRRHTLLLILLFATLNMARGQTSYFYRYWMDNNAAGVTTGSGTGEKSFDVDMSQLSAGLHAMHLQAYNAKGVLSAVLTKFFVKMADTKSTSGQYWFDNDASTKKTIAASGTIDVDVTALSSSLHALHYQTLPSNGVPSVVHTQFFVKMADTKSASGQYWFDNDVSTKKTVAASGTIDVDVTALAPGLHALHYQTLASNGVTSVVHTQFFMKMADTKSTSGQYWFDNDVSTKKTFAASGIIDVDMSALSSGLHTLHYQLLSSDGTPSATKTQYVLLPEPQQDEQMVAQVWFDDEHDNSVTYDIVNNSFVVNTDQLEDGHHLLSVLLLNSSGNLRGLATTEFDWGIETGADALTVDRTPHSEGNAYNLCGQRVQHLRKGQIYIVDGRKKVAK